MMTYAILREGLYGGFHYVKKDRLSETIGAAGGNHFYADHLGYAKLDEAVADASLLRAENEKQVEFTKRRKKTRTHPASFTVVEITREFLSAIDEKIEASRKRGAS